MKFILLLLLQVLSHSVLAQSLEKERLLEEMLFTTTEQRQLKINEFKKFFSKDSAGIMAAYREIGNHGKKNGDVLLEICEPSGYLGILRHSTTISNSTLLAGIDSVYKIYKSKNVSPIFYSSMERHLSEFYLLREKNYAIAFKHLDNGFDYLHQVDITEYPYKLNEALYLNYVFYDFKDYEKVLLLAKEVLKDDDKLQNRFMAKNLKLTVSHTLRDIKMLDSSDVYLNQILKEAIINKDTAFHGIAWCYLGYNQYLRKNIEQAKLNYEKGLGIMNNNEYVIPYKVLFLSHFAALSIDTPNKSKLQEYAAEMSKFGIMQAHARDRAMISRNLSKVYAALGDNQKASKCLDSLEMSENYVYETYDSRRYLRTQQQEELNRIQKEKATIVFVRNISLILISVLFALSLIYYWFRISKKNKQVEAIKQELDYSKKQLFDIAQHFKDKNKTQILTSDNAIQYVSLQILEESTILTKEQWETFKYHFEKVYPGFLKNLSKSYPDLSQGEIRFLCLKKMGFSNKEMAETLGVSDQSIRTTLHRLRKKVNLSSDDDIEVLLENL